MNARRLNRRAPADRLAGAGVSTARRRGSFVVEVSAAVVLLGLVMVMAVEFLAWRTGELQALERQRWAVAEARNVIERVAALPVKQRTPEALASLNLSARTAKALPEGQVSVKVEPDPELPRLARIGVTVSWRSKVRQESVRLTRFAVAVNTPGEARR